jgi:hypothetical protein
MAQKVQVILVDDIDGGEAEESVSFSLDGVNYEIDLSESNAASLREALAPWVGHARRTGGRSATRRGGGSAGRSRSPKSDLGDVRAWARENGFQVSDRGRVSSEVMQAYEAAH